MVVMLLLLNPASTQVWVARRICVPIKLGTVHCVGVAVAVAVAVGVGLGATVAVGVAVAVAVGVAVAVAVGGGDGVPQGVTVELCGPVAGLPPPLQKQWWKAVVLFCDPAVALLFALV